MAKSNFEGLGEILNSKALLGAYAQEPLIVKKPTLQDLKKFLENVTISAM